jgi:uncharacterized protein YkwD
LRRPILGAVGLALMTCLSANTFTTPAYAAPDTASVVAEARQALERSHLSHEHRVQLHLFILINEYRAQHGLYPLQLDERLNASAWEHSVDMAAKRYCRHGGSDGSSVRTRMARHGYGYNNWAGENIVCGRSSAEVALNWWKNSTPHRRNLLHGHFTHIGIAMAPNGPWGPMWTLNFASGQADTLTPIAFALPAESTGAQAALAAEDANDSDDHEVAAAPPADQEVAAAAVADAPEE